jgi:hypothetical protein
VLFGDPKKGAERQKPDTRRLIGFQAAAWQQETV